MLNQILLSIFLFFYVHGSAEVEIPKIDFYPQELKAILEGDTRKVSFGIRWENSTDHAMTDSLIDFHGDYRVSVVSEDGSRLEIVNSSYPQCIPAFQEPKNFSFTVKGIFLGYTKVRVSLQTAYKGCIDSKRNRTPSSLSGKSWDIYLTASVIRRPAFLVNIVTLSVSVLVALNFINMGVQLDMKCIAQVLKKPIGPAIGFVCQFLFMPLASFIISMLILEDNSLRLGLFILGCSPGGSMSNFWTLLFDGDVNLSVTMTFISTLAALGLMPLWIFTLGSSLFHDQKATVPYINIVVSLVFLTFPIGIGLLIQRYSSRLSRISKKIIEPVTIICVFFAIFAGLYANTYVFKIVTWDVILAGIIIAWSGYCFGALMAWLFRLDKSQIIAVSIETAFQNPAVPYVMLLMSLPQPDADLAIVPPCVQTLLTGLPMWVLLLLARAYRKAKVCCGEEIVEKPEKDIIQKEYRVVDTNPPDGCQTIALEIPRNKVRIVRVSFQ